MTNTVRVGFFDTWQGGYGQAQVTILLANTTTLAEVFTDEACTVPASNPQTLAQMTIGVISYGRWLVPLYTNAPYELDINGVDQTAVVAPPLTTLVAQDASEATVIPTGGTVASNLDDLFARSVDVRDFGVFLPAGAANASAITNNTSLVAAIDAVTSGGYVDVPQGTFQFTNLSLPANVVLRGAGREVTILQSTIAGAVVTLAGGSAGFKRLTLDGINQATGSIGVFAAGVDFVVFGDVRIKRFDTGLQRFGGTGSHWDDLFLTDNLIGYDAQGYSDNGNGGILANECWDGGKIELNATTGLSLKYVDSPVSGLTFRNIGFDTNTQTAISALGTNNIKIVDCWGLGNGSNFVLNDAVPVVAYNSSADTLGNQLDGFEVIGGRWGPAISPLPASSTNTVIAAVNSVISLTGNLNHVAFWRCILSYQTVDISNPINNILVEDCTESYGMVFGGTTPSAWTRLSLLTPNSATLASSGVVYLQAPSPTILSLIPQGGSNLTINGLYYPVPSGGVTSLLTPGAMYVNGVANQTLAASTVYDVFVFNNSGTLTFDFWSTGGHMTDPSHGNVGIEVRNNGGIADSTRSYVGKIATSASTTIPTQGVNVLSWFNRRQIIIIPPNLVTGSTTSVTPGEISPAGRVFFLTFGSAVGVQQFQYFGLVACPVGGGNNGIGLDGAYTQGSQANNITVTMAAIYQAQLTEGQHYVTPFGFSSVGGQTTSFTDTYVSAQTFG